MFRRNTLLSLGAVSFDNPVDALVVEPSLSRGDLSHAAYEQVRRDRPGQDSSNAAAQIVNCLVFAGAMRHNNHFSTRLSTANDFRNGFGRIWRQTRFEEDYICGSARYRRQSLRQRLGLRNNLEVFFQGEDLSHADAENSFGIGNDQPDRRVPDVHRGGVGACACSERGPLNIVTWN